MKGLVFAGIVCVTLTLGAGAPKAGADFRDRYWENVTEPAASALAVPSAPGFHGRVTRLERLWPENAAGDETRLWKGLSWRNERVHAQFVVWSGEKVKDLRATVGALTSSTGETIPASALEVRFVRNVLGAPSSRSKVADKSPRVYGDVLDRDLRPDLQKNGYRALWLTVRTPADIPAGTYRGRLRVAGDGDVSVAFDLELEVVGRTLPDPKDWKMFVNIWQHPLNVAKYHRVRPFSNEHYRLMLPLFRELAEAGQKSVFARILERPWLDGGRYRAQVLHVRKPDGSFVRDWTILDQYVAFAQRAGIGKFIELNSIARRNDNYVFYVDERTGDLVQERFAIGSPESDVFWGSFLVECERHMREKGWFEDTYIELDELSLEELEPALGLIRRHAPKFKVSFACDKDPTRFLAYGMEHYSQALRDPETMFPPAFWTALEQRRRDPRCVTTFYICNLPGKPNTWIRSSYDECAWQGLFASAKGFDGFLRWAAFAWGRDPLWDASCPPHYDAGESFLLYPGMRASTRWEVLRDSFENYEKIRILRETDGMTPALEKALSGLTAECVRRYADEAAFAVGEARAAAQVSPVLMALDEASRKGM